MLEPTTEKFAEKVMLLLIDKVAIGALIWLAAFCASIVLERFKAALSFHSEVDKIRVEKMGEVWNIFGPVYSQLNTAFERRGRIVNEEIKSWKKEFDSLDDEAKIEMEILRVGEIPEKARNRIISEIKPSLEQTLQELLKSGPILDAGRYWLGERLYGMHLKHLNDLVKFSTELVEGLLTQNIEQFFETLHIRLKASRSRLDIKQVEKVL